MRIKSFVALLIVATALVALPARATYAATATSCTYSIVGVNNTPPADGLLKPNRWNYTATNWHASQQGCNGDGAMNVKVETVAPLYSTFYVNPADPNGYWDDFNVWHDCTTRSDGRIVTCTVVLGQNSPNLKLYGLSISAPAWGYAMPGCPATVNAEVRMTRLSDGAVLSDGFFPIQHTC
jgi:hypothetical protein